MSYASDYPEKIEREKLRLMDMFRSGKTPRIVHGAFGPETEDSDAYEEEIIRPPEGGRMTKLWGCSYLYKGNFDAELVHGIQMPKAMFSEVLAEMLVYLPFVGIGWFLTYIFQRKALLRFINDFMDRMEWRVMKWYFIPENEYNDFTKEIKRAVRASTDDSVLGLIVRRITEFVCLVIETDNAYRLRFQDAIPHAYKIREKPTIYDILDVLISRETARGIGHKWRRMKMGLKVVLPLYPELNRIVKKVLENLEPEKCKSDDADWYFGLRFLSYDFRGMGVDEREAERKRLDQLNSHIYFI